MKITNTLISVMSIVALSGCNSLTLDSLVNTGGSGEGLDSVFINQENVEFEFLESGELHKTGEAFLPPKTINCAKLALTPDGYAKAIDAGASVIRIRTPSVAKTFTENPRNGQPVEKIVQIKPYFGGVLALCNVSTRATGMDSRSYNIRGLDQYFVKGSEGRISVVAAVVNVGASKSNLFGDILKSPSVGASKQYSWMLWLTDRSSLFTDRIN